MNDALLRLVLIAIAAITVLSGAAQLIVPTVTLSFIAKPAEPLSPQLFATVGMFMVITGALFFESLWNRSGEGAIPFWIGVQKLAAAALVTFGWTKGVLVGLAVGVAAFDFVSGVLCFVFWRRLGR